MALITASVAAATPILSGSILKNPAITIASENTDIKASIYNNGGHLKREYNDPRDTHVTIPSANGLMYLKIEAPGNANMSAQFMTGKYKVEC